MKLSPHHYVFLFEIEGLARRSSWNPFMSSMKNHRLQDPSIIAVRGSQVVAIWTRTSEPRVQPDLDRFEKMGMATFLVVEGDRESKADLKFFLDAPPQMT